MVKCRLNGGLYVRKSIDRATAIRCNQASTALLTSYFLLEVAQQCFPQTERDILLLARRTSAQFIPHLIAAFQTQDNLCLMMPYGSGGTLWDVLESSANCIIESDLKWWIPQTVSAISWCHEQGFCHRCV